MILNNIFLAILQENYYFVHFLNIWIKEKQKIDVFSLDSRDYINKIEISSQETKQND